MTMIVRNVVAYMGMSFAAMALSAARADSRAQPPAVEQDTMADSRECLSTTTNDGEGVQAMCGKCGDGFCNPRCGETPTSCPADCGGTSI